MIDWISANVLNWITGVGSLIAAAAALWNVRLTRKQIRQIQTEKMDSLRPTVIAKKGGTISEWIWITVTIKTKEIGTVVETLEILGEPAAKIVPFYYSDIPTFGIREIFKRTDFTTYTNQYVAMEEMYPHKERRLCFWYHLEPSTRRRFSKFSISRRQYDRSASVLVSLLSMDSHIHRTKMEVAVNAIERKKTEIKNI